MSRKRTGRQVIALRSNLASFSQNEDHEHAQIAYDMNNLQVLKHSQNRRVKLLWTRDPQKKSWVINGQDPAHSQILENSDASIDSRAFAQIFSDRSRRDPTITPPDRSHCPSMRLLIVIGP
jgi:hypothetical protein